MGFGSKMPHRKGRKCPWLVTKSGIGGTNRRTIQKDVRNYLEPREVYELLIKNEWDYSGGQFNKKGTQYGRDKLHARDRCFGAVEYAASLRLEETLLITKGHFVEMKDLSYYRNPDKDFLMMHNVWISKRQGAHTRNKAVWDPEKEKWKNVVIYVPATEHPIIDIPLPRVGRLGPFTKLIEDYLKLLRGKDTKLFPFGDSRAWVIINHITGGKAGDKSGGKWNHWFRAMSFSYQVNLIRSDIKVAKTRGIANPDTLRHYHRGNWESDMELLKE